MGLRLLGLPAVEHGRQRLALRCVGTLVDNPLHRTVAFVHGARPSVQKGKAQSIEPDVAEMAALNPTHLEASAIALAGSSLELTGTEVITVAVAERDSLDAPVDHPVPSPSRDRGSPSRRSRFWSSGGSCRPEIPSRRRNRCWCPCRSAGTGHPVRYGFRKTRHRRKRYCARCR